MKMRQISSFGYQLTRLGLFNAYLVRESDSYTLIDTALPGSADALLDAARTCGVGVIARILLTHAHGDHIGSLDALAVALGQVDVAISHREARLLPKKPVQDRSLDPGDPQCKVKGSFPGAKTAHAFDR
jgi:glyoxylase-like metal-dependent hydrolase (beta-lactamase superfamily II)